MAPAPKDSGMGTSYQLPYTNSLVIVAFLSIAWYNVLELTILIQAFFKRHSGLYYYSLIVANWGIFFHGLETLLKFFKLNEDLPGHKIANTVVGWSGWVMMVTGQSIVLWSRLHLVQAPWSRVILGIIVTNAVVLHTTTGVLTFLTNISHHPEQYKVSYSIIERIQVTIFFLQEVVLSSMYIWRTVVILRSEGPIFNTGTDRHVRGTKGRKVLIYTITMGAVIIALDVTLIALEFSGLYDIQTSYKDAVYAIKLKMEFSILNQLINLVKGRLTHLPSSSHVTHHPSSGRRFSPSQYAKRNSSIMRTSSLRSPPNALGHTAGAYSRMEDSFVLGDKGREIQLQGLKANDVLKTTTTEVRIDRIERIGEENDSESDGEKDLRSPTSMNSEMYIIENNKPV